MRRSLLGILADQNEIQKRHFLFPLDTVTFMQYLERGLPSWGHEGSHLKELANGLKMAMGKDKKKLFPNSFPELLN